MIKAVTKGGKCEVTLSGNSLDTVTQVMSICQSVYESIDPAFKDVMKKHVIGLAESNFDPAYFTKKLKEQENEQV